MILYGNEVGTVLEKVITFLPKFEIYKNNVYRLFIERTIFLYSTL